MRWRRCVNCVFSSMCSACHTERPSLVPWLQCMAISLRPGFDVVCGDWLHSPVTMWVSNRKVEYILRKEKKIAHCEVTFPLKIHSAHWNLISPLKFEGGRGTHGFFKVHAADRSNNYKFKIRVFTKYYCTWLRQQDGDLKPSCQTAECLTRTAREMFGWGYLPASEYQLCCKTNFLRWVVGVSHTETQIKH